MGKIVIFDMNSTMIPQVGVMIDEALTEKERGHDLTYITCGGCLEACYSNPFKSKAFCKICVSDYKSNLQGLVGDRLRHKTLQDYATPSIEKEVASFDVSFDSVKELKDILYKDIDIGYAALSSFISNTRNLNPVLSTLTKAILARQLRAGVRMALLCEKVLQEEKPEKIILFNGRMSESRPVFRFFQAQGIPVEIKEVYRTNLDGNFKKITFYNSLPHSIQYFHKRIEEEWNKDTAKGAELGQQFFINRRNANFSGDKIYTKHQTVGLLPKSWNKSARNIVIFNSSEDEYAAIGKEWERKVFPSQLLGIQFISDCARKYPNSQIYLRVHPNLKKISYKYHTDLYKLATHDRMHIISANSDVSTYALIDAADVVISFGSTVGAEAAYARKPVVLLGATSYSNLDFCYEPKTPEEVERLIFEERLEPLINENVLKYGNYIMTNKGQDYSYYNFNCRQIKIGSYATPNVTMIGQTEKPFGALRSFVMRFWRWLQRRQLKLRIPEA